MEAGSRLPTKWPVLGMIPGFVSRLHWRESTWCFHDWTTEVLREIWLHLLLKGPWCSGMDILGTSDPANIRYIFNANFANYPKGGQFLEIFDILGDGIFNADSDSWKTQRKVANSRMPRFWRFVARVSREKVEKVLIPLLARAAEHAAVVDLQDVFLRFTFDTTCNLVFGVDPGCLSPDLPSVPFANALDDAEEVLFFRQAVPMGWWKLLRWLQVGEEKKMVLASETICNFITGRISERMDEVAKVRQDKEVPMRLEVQLDAGRKRHLSTRQVDPVVFGADDLSSAIYLEAALFESLRLFPPVPFEHNGAARPDVLPSGHKVDPKAKIVIPLYVMARVEGIWGKDCCDDWKLKHEPLYKFLSFNSGPRICLGKDMAFTQLKVVAANLLHKFHITVVKGHVEVPSLSIILHMKHGLRVNVEKRV
ncbi:unnamed protein product [Spirodela intermedia]|uniref:Uncharacterized protein n=1 Tax=Spirodela intermedia TaxID=51605 RepID=A0A7I8J9W7_SPIIN|nr:unnamed protein product [Spirodela intermedia]CAA6666233.1 unnamed protein product [Spirodela intermedia]